MSRVDGIDRSQHAYHTLDKAKAAVIETVITQGVQVPFEQ